MPVTHCPNGTSLWGSAGAGDESAMFSVLEHGFWASERLLAGRSRSTIQCAIVNFCTHPFASVPRRPYRTTGIYSFLPLCRPPTDFPTQTDPSQSSRLVKHRAKGGRAHAISSCLDVVTSPDPLVASRSRLTRRTPMTLLRCSC